MTDRTVRAIIRGRVQGVGFRFWTVATARSLDLAGFVRNRQDGTVEAVLRGPAEAVGTMLHACRQGPPSARVDGVETMDVPAEAAGEGGFDEASTI